MAGQSQGKVSRPEDLTQAEFKKAGGAAKAIDLTRAPDAQALIDLVAREKILALEAVAGTDKQPEPFDNILERAVIAYQRDAPARVEGGSPNPDAPQKPNAPVKSGDGVKTPSGAPKVIAAGSPTTREASTPIELGEELALDDDDDAPGEPLDIDRLKRPDGMTEMRFEQLVADAITYRMSPGGAQTYIDKHIGTVASTRDDEKGGSYPTMMVGRDKVHCPTARLPNGRLTRSIPQEGALLPWYLHPAPPPKGCVIVPEEVMTMAAQEGLTDADIRELMKNYARKKRMRDLSERLA